jgi:hypothetical protein
VRLSQFRRTIRPTKAISDELSQYSLRQTKHTGDGFSPVYPQRIREQRDSPPGNPLLEGVFVGEPAGIRTQDTRIRRVEFEGLSKPAVFDHDHGDRTMFERIMAWLEGDDEAVTR